MKSIFCKLASQNWAELGKPRTTWDNPKVTPNKWNKEKSPLLWADNDTDSDSSWLLIVCSSFKFKIKRSFGNRHKNGIRADFSQFLRDISVRNTFNPKSPSV